MFMNRINLIDILCDYGRTHDFADVEPYSSKALIFTP